MKNIFLSASIPVPSRHPKYYDTADIIAIRDAIIALSSVVIPKHRIIWGGHPSITPLIYFVMERFVINKIDKDDLEFEFTQEEKNKIDFMLKSNIQEHVKLYQSLWFEDIFPPDNNKFENIVFTKKGQTLNASIELMRKQMLTENEFAAAVFIGGMNGIEDEYRMFKEYHPKALLFPIASTGAATKIVYDDLFPKELKNKRLEKDYGYMSLFQKLLMDKI